MHSLKKAQLVARLALHKKAQKLKILDMRATSNFCDFFILLSASSSRRAQAIVDNIEDGLRKEHLPIKAQEGKSGSSWILLDLFDVVVHIFTENTREFYNLDRLWADAPVLKFPARKNVYKRAQVRRASQSTARKRTA